MYIFRRLIILLFVFAVLVIAVSCLSNSPFLWIITPEDLYDNTIPYPLYLSWLSFSHLLYFRSSSINIILDLFLFSFMWLFSAHYSHTSMTSSKLGSPTPSMLVSSANIYGQESYISSSSSVRSFVKMLKSRHDIPHPYPSPLPIYRFPSFDSIVRLLNINFSPCMTYSDIPIFSIFSNRRLWLTMSYALAKSTNRVHIFPLFSFYSVDILLSSLYILSSVPYPYMKPVYWWCNFHCPSWFHMSFLSCLFRHLSYIFQKNDIMEIGLVL